MMEILYLVVHGPVGLDYCDVAWHECGQGNSEEVE